MYRNSSLLALVFVLYLASCAKEGPTGPTGPAGPSFTGTVSGHVHLFDKYGSEILSGYTGIMLNIAGATVTPPAPATIFADATGFYRYPNIVTGSYTITASDTVANSYGATQLNNVEFLSGTLNKDISLSHIPDSFLASFTARPAATLNDSLALTVIAPDTRRRNCIVFVNYSPVASGYLLKYIVPIPANITSVNSYIPQQDLLNAGFKSGSKVYFAAYSYVVNDASVYENTSIGKNVYTAINANAIVDSTVVP